MAKAERIKRTHKFQLDINKDVESWLHEWIEHLTKQRKFSQYVRDGLRLMIDLSAGNLDVLIELFPWVSERLAQGHGATPPTPQPPPVINQTELAKEIAAQIVLQGGVNPIEMRSTNTVATQEAPKVSTGQGTKQIPAPNFAMPVFDDDDDLSTVIVTTKNTNTISTQNFLRSLTGIGVETKPSSVREVRTA